MTSTVNVLVTKRYKPQARLDPLCDSFSSKIWMKSKAKKQRRPQTVGKQDDICRISIYFFVKQIEANCWELLSKQITGPKILLTRFATRIVHFWLMAVRHTSAIVPKVYIYVDPCIATEIYLPTKSHSSMISHNHILPCYHIITFPPCHHIITFSPCYKITTFPLCDNMIIFPPCYHIIIFPPSYHIIIFPLCYYDNHILSVLSNNHIHSMLSYDHIPCMLSHNHIRLVIYTSVALNDIAKQIEAVNKELSSNYKETKNEVRISRCFIRRMHHTHIHSYIHTYTFIHTCIHILYIHSYIHACM